MDTQEPYVSSMFSVMQYEYDKSQEDYEEDRQWLAKEWEKHKPESTEENDSDTLSCSDFDCIDKLNEDENSIPFIPIDNISEHSETGCSSVIRVGDFTTDDGCTSEAIEDQTSGVYVTLPYAKQYYYSGNTHNTQEYNNNSETLDVIVETKTLYDESSELTGDKDLVDLRSYQDEEHSVVSEESYRDQAHEDCMDLSIIDEECIADDLETSDSNGLVDDVNSEYYNDEPVNDCHDHGCDGNVKEVHLTNFFVNDKEQTKTLYDSSSGHYEACSKGVKIIVIGKKADKDGEVSLHEEELSDHVQEEPTEQSQPEENDTHDKNNKHQTTQTCDILFTDKEKSSEDMFICEYCQKVFANQYKLDSHRFRSHCSSSKCKERNVVRPKSKPEAVDDWPPNIQKLARRINGKKVFFCNLCSYIVDRCDSITKHMFRIHSNGRPVPQFQCEVCGKVFVDRAYLRNHKVSHMTEKLHSCDVCGRAFHRQPSLKRHLQTHTDDRQYSCTLCDYQTNRKHMMYNHVEHHKLGRAYICHICHSHLYTQLAYRSHMYEHRVPTNSCSFCKVGFSSKERMMNHMRKAHSAYEINVYKNEAKKEPLD